MKKLLLVPALLFAACGDNLTPDEDQIAPTNTSESDAGEAPADTPELIASFTTAPVNCDLHSVRFEGRYAYADGTAVDNPICHYDFGDGTSADTCSVVHEFSDVLSNVVFTVEDPATGAVASATDLVLPPKDFDASLLATSDGLSISWEAHSYYDGGDFGNLEISIDPAEQVIVDDPAVFTYGLGSVRVTAAGTYTVKLHTETGFGDPGGCEVDLVQLVEVICNDAH